MKKLMIILILVAMMPVVASHSMIKTEIKNMSPGERLRAIELELARGEKADIAYIKQLEHGLSHRYISDRMKGDIAEAKRMHRRGGSRVRVIREEIKALKKEEKKERHAEIIAGNTLAKAFQNTQQNQNDKQENESDHGRDYDAELMDFDSKIDSFTKKCNILFDQLQMPNNKDSIMETVSELNNILSKTSPAYREKMLQYFADRFANETYEQYYKKYLSMITEKVTKEQIDAFLNSYEKNYALFFKLNYKKNTSTTLNAGKLCLTREGVFDLNRINRILNLDVKSPGDLIMIDSETYKEDINIETNKIIFEKILVPIFKNFHINYNDKTLINVLQELTALYNQGRLIIPVGLTEK